MPLHYAGTCRPRPRSVPARVVEGIDAGIAFINRGFDISPHLGFGGVEATGYGRVGGRWAAEESMNQKYVVTT